MPEFSSFLTFFHSGLDRFVETAIHRTGPSLMPIYRRPPEETQTLPLSYFTRALESRNNKARRVSLQVELQIFAWITRLRVQIPRGRFCFSPLQACDNDCTVQCDYSDACWAQNRCNCGNWIALICNHCICVRCTWLVVYCNFPFRKYNREKSYIKKNMQARESGNYLGYLILQ